MKADYFSQTKKHFSQTKKQQVVSVIQECCLHDQVNLKLHLQHKRKIICCQRSKKNSYYVSCVYYVSPPSSQRTISKRIEYQPKSNEKYTGFLHCISSFEDNSCINICKMNHQIFYFLLFYTSLYISRHHFSQIFRTSLNIIFKKDLSQISLHQQVH